MAVTGCTSGTGKIFARVCAQKGAKLVLLNRDSLRATEALREISEVSQAAGAPEPLGIPCDLTSFKSVREAGAKLQAELREVGLDVLCNNAGIMGFGDKATEDGCDIQMQTNHLSHFLLTYLCMPLLDKAASLRGESRVVNHSSSARVMDGPEFTNKLQEKYLQKNGGNLGGNSDKIMQGANFVRYQQSKLANVVFTYALHKRLQDCGSKVKALVAHPGVAPTQLSVGTMSAGGASDLERIPAWATKLFFKLKYQTEEDGTVGILRNSCDPAAESGDFFGPLGRGGATGAFDPSEFKGPVGLLKIFKRVAARPAAVLGICVRCRLTVAAQSVFWFLASALHVNHYLAIFFMAIGLQGKVDGRRNWLVEYDVQDTNFWDVYAISLHWSLTQFTPATNNIGATNSIERLFAICVVLVALALFSSFLSSITNAVTALRAVRLDYASQEAQIRQFFNERNLPASLLAQVKAFMRLRSSAIRRVLEQDVKLLAELPDALKKKPLGSLRE
ncbi:unnamed protein product [Symbiodinium natans]|uniref:Short-chain dehydrogenase TIC 32, chloroplastic n=1 Tax=Symbiodinium natans TaxID=878477 RepID=A0A812SYA5_9DINO|nr:unnamed protein product [Symbiodinium natans]